MANRYWVGGNGSWHDTAHWSTTSGGSGGASIPTASDDVYINSSSFTDYGSVIISADVSTKSFTWTENTYASLSFSTVVLVNIYGGLSINIGRSIVVESGGSIPFVFCAASGGPYNISLPSFQVPLRLYINASGSVTYNLASNVNCHDIITYNGVFNTNNYTINCVADVVVYDYTNSTVGPPATPYTNNTSLGTSTITCSNFYSITDHTYVTLAAQNATLAIYNSTFNTGNWSFGQISMAGYTMAINGNLTASSLTLAPISTPSPTITIQSNRVLTLGNLIISTSAANRIIRFRSSSVGQQYTLSSASPTTTYDYIDIKDCLATGGSFWNAGYHSIDSGNNTGWYFPSRNSSIFFGAAF